MKLYYIHLIFFVSIYSFNCQSQNNSKMKDQTNPLLCNPESGICEIPNNIQPTDIKAIKQMNKPIQLVYFTDPICSSCWGIEPQLRKLKLEYGDLVEVDYRMGGLLPDWSYNNGGISKPSDVAHHWDEVSAYYDMPIDGDIWLEDPLSSSYPPSIAFKAAQIQDKGKAILYLRQIREMVFIEKKNIAKRENLEEAAIVVGLDIKQFREDCLNKAKQLFEEDLKLGRSLGVRGFPTLFFMDNQGNKEIVYGSKPYSTFVDAVQKLLPAVQNKDYNKNWEDLFSIYSTMTAREFSELSETPRNKVENILEELTTNGFIEKISTKNGNIWKLK